MVPLKANLKFACEMFARAVEVDPRYAPAHAGLAEGAAQLHMYYPSAEGDQLEVAHASSARALELDPGLAEAHAGRGLALFLSRRMEEAEREFKAAIAADPSLPEARYYYARTCFQQGRHAEAARLCREANAAREGYQAAFFAAQASEAAGEHAEALEAYRLALGVCERLAQHDVRVPDCLRCQRSATVTARLEQVGVAALHLHRRQRLQLIVAEESRQPPDRLLVPAGRGRSQRGPGGGEPVVEILADLDRRPRHRHTAGRRADRFGQCLLGSTLGAEALAQELAALARFSVEARVDTECPASVLAEHRPASQSRSVRAFDALCTFCAPDTGDQKLGQHLVNT